MTTGQSTNRSSAAAGIIVLRIVLAIIVSRFVFVPSTTTTMIRYSHAKTTPTMSTSTGLSGPTTTNRSSHNDVVVRHVRAGGSSSNSSDIALNHNDNNTNNNETDRYNTGTGPSHSEFTVNHLQPPKEQRQETTDYSMILEYDDRNQQSTYPHDSSSSSSPFLPDGSLSSAIPSYHDDAESCPVVSPNEVTTPPSFAPSSVPSTPTIHVGNDDPVEETSTMNVVSYADRENVVDHDKVDPVHELSYMMSRSVVGGDDNNNNNNKLGSPTDSEDIESTQDNNNGNSNSNNQRIRFFNRIARVSTILLRREKDARLLKDGHNVSDSTDDDDNDDDGHDDDDGEDDIVDDEVTFQSDLTRPGRYVHIVTTASLPWFTGTAVNPLLRAAYLHERLERINRDANVTHPLAETTNPMNDESTRPNDDETHQNRTKTSWVTLVIPWLELPEDQRKVYHGQVFDEPKDQERYVRGWLRDHAGMPDAAENLNLVFYTARYHEGLGSVFAMGDIIQQLPQDELDICVLEEPEHVNWFRAPGQGWTKRYNYVIGIVHTNYDQYATQHYSGLWTAPAIRLMSAAMIRAYCHKVIKLSDVVQVFAPEKEVTVNVHGVRKEFIASPLGSIKNVSNTSGIMDNQGDEGKRRSSVYFIGKLLWAKGLDMLLELEDYYKQVTGEYFPIDIYGSGPDMEDIERAYLGRWAASEHPKSKIRKTSKNLFSKFFSFINRRRWKRRRQRSKKYRSNRGAALQVTNSTDYSVATTPEELYRDIVEVLEALPEKAKESIEWFPNQARETIGQWTEDIEFTKKSMQRLPAKARRAVNKLLDDLSRTPIPRSLHELRLQPVPATFPGRIDHALLKGDTHKIFVNPSVSEVLCTTTAEALAMGKFVIIPVHPENYFFLKNPNCLAYRTPYEFVANLQWALTHDPAVLTEEQSRIFTWEAATDRLIDAAAITHREARDRELLGRSRMDERIAWFHNEIGKGVKGDIIRKALGGGPVSGQVRYVSRTQQFDDVVDDDDDEEEEDDGLPDGDETEGLSKKFRDSAFVQALRTAFENGATSYG